MHTTLVYGSSTIEFFQLSTVPPKNVEFQNWKFAHHSFSIQPLSWWCVATTFNPSHYYLLLVLFTLFNFFQSSSQYSDGVPCSDAFYRAIILVECWTFFSRHFCFEIFSRYFFFRHYCFRLFAGHCGVLTAK